jgi:hypothetical protein
MDPPKQWPVASGQASFCVSAFEFLINDPVAMRHRGKMPSGAKWQHSIVRIQTRLSKQQFDFQ